MAKTKVLICPYCGDTQTAGERCRSCGGFFEPLSRQATHNAMGPWFIRDDGRPFQPGCSYETLIKLIERGQVTKYSIIRSPTTKQFWTVAKRVPGISHLLGYCHSCDASVDPGDHGCHACGVPFGAYLDRNYLGLPDVHPLPWEAPGGGGEEPAMAASPRKIDFRRAAEPLGISSFASDEELRGHGFSPASTHMPASASVMTSTTPGRPARAAWKRPSDASGSADEADDVMTASTSSPVHALETSPAGAAARAMQRRFDAQRRTIRLLAVALLVLAALTVISLIAIASRGGSTGESPAKSTTGDTSSQATHTSNSHLSPGATSAPVASSAPAIVPQIIDDAPASEPVAPTFEAELAQANELIKQAQRTDRESAERIRDYEEALRVLKDIDDKTTADQKPANLAALIKQVENALGLLKFFP